VTRSVCSEGECWGVERSEAEAIYEAGKERCVEFVLELAQALERLTVANARLEERVRKLEERTRESSRNSSKPPS
jgi:division protein CdvB (Snf7/Vps24/ESCRT-III family)